VGRREKVDGRREKGDGRGSPSSVSLLSSTHFVRMEGLEPPRITPPDPKSGAATNYATCASFFTGMSLLKRAANISNSFNGKKASFL
jgi:hypothetical protein